jgi:UDP-glucose:glycoprotein glucosyltransferase
MEYLETSLSKKKTSSPHAGTFQNIMDNRKLKPEKRSLPLQEVLEDSEIGSHLEMSKEYLARLGANSPTPPFFVNGAPLPMNDEWLPNLSQRVTRDLITIQRGIFEEQFMEDMWLPSIFLEGASQRRNALIIPEDEKDIKLLNLANIYADHESTLKALPSIPVDEDSRTETWTTQLLVVADFDTSRGLELAMNAIEWRKANKHTEIIFVHSGKPRDTDLAKSAIFFSLIPAGKEFSHDELSNLYNEISGLDASTEIPTESASAWPETAPLIQSLSFQSGESGLVINGRKLGPLPDNATFAPFDYQTLFDFERRKRIVPAATAVLDLGLFDKLGTTYDTAKICSLLAVSTVSDLPEGIFDLPPPIRTNYFNNWNASHTAITIRDNSTAIIQIIVSLDPASEIAQRWVPIIKTLSELDGVYTRIYLNPREKLQELPVKRFYRYVLQSKPSFDDDGSLRALSADFEGLPKETLLNMAMDVPPSWLVAPKKSIYDLDNIKLSSVAADAVVDATYELENILIEGHSRDVTAGMPPRGAQLVLSTAAEPHITDTIVMANLGYFQFKANPGYYSLRLQSGPSEEIFNIDSVGAMGYSAQPGDETTDVALLSFQGVTLFPRLSRKPGKEEEDVLDSLKTSSASDILSKGSAFVDGLLHRTGLKKDHTPGKYTHPDTKLHRLFAYIWPGTASGRHADINIFSVASGHLYERMLNIMMVSVMRHTNHTVKFWFVEQFLSPSFKSFLPTMAKEYNFEYEMVTYKWPHWLRGQKEKQREIWGYKILFLDVLFPLDLDKVIFVDADQIVRTDMYELVTHDLKGAPYGFTPMCDSRTEMEGFRFWKQGYWKNFLRGLPYHISALYVVDLKRFRQIAAGDRLRQQYHQLSADPNSLSNLDQDLPNNMQSVLPIHSLPQEWLWCETWCSDESLKDARTIDLCNNPLTKEPKLDRARRQVPEWTVYDDEIAELARRTKMEDGLLKGDEQESALDERTREASSTEEARSSHVRDEL